jgi:hypothetical protein
VGFHGEKRSNETHQSRTDPDARLYKKGAGQAARLCYLEHAVMENRHGLLVDFLVTTASITAEWPNAITPSRTTTAMVATTKRYSTTSFALLSASHQPGLARRSGDPVDDFWQVALDLTTRLRRIAD